MSSARQNTLSRMRLLIAASTTTAALSVNCNDCGYTTVDPLPGPGPIGGRGFCGSIASTFKVGARAFTPTSVSDAGGGSLEDAASSSPEDAGNDGGDSGGGDAGGTRRDGGSGSSGGMNETQSRAIFFAIELRSGTVGGGGITAGISLKRAVFTVQSGKILNLRQSELLSEMDIDTTGLSRVTISMVLDATCGGSGTTTLRFEIQLDSSGEVTAISGDDSFAGGGFEELQNEL